MVLDFLNAFSSRQRHLNVSQFIDLCTRVAILRFGRRADLKPEGPDLKALRPAMQKLCSNHFAPAVAQNMLKPSKSFHRMTQVLACRDDPNVQQIVLKHQKDLLKVGM